MGTVLLNRTQKGLASWRADVTWLDLEAATGNDLKRIYRAQPGLGGPLGVSDLRDELQRRQFDRMTRVLVRLTWLITVLTAINVGVVIAQ